MAITKKTLRRVAVRNIKRVSRGTRQVSRKLQRQTQRVSKKATKVGKQAAKQATKVGKKAAKAATKAATKVAKSKTVKLAKKKIGNAATSIVQDIDHGYHALMDRLTGPPESVQVGVFGDAASAPEEGTAATVGQIAEWAEFGIGQPQRSWLRGYVDENKDDVARILKVGGQRVFKGQWSQREALDKVGLYLVGKIKLRIAAGIAPPNEQSTIRIKGSSTPLIRFGQFRNSIAHQLV